MGMLKEQEFIISHFRRPEVQMEGSARLLLFFSRAVRHGSSLGPSSWLVGGHLHLLMAFSCVQVCLQFSLFVRTPDVLEEGPSS